MIFVKALATAVFLALVGVLVGPLVGLTCCEFPEGVCGMYWVIPAGKGAICGAAAGGFLGFVLGLAL